MESQTLIALARAAAEKAWAPYSRFRVGAALLCADGTVITGVNVENRSFGLTNCAERSAVFAALSAGKKEFSSLALCCIDADYPVPPCGACRQVLSEFAGKDFPVYCAGKKDEISALTLGELYPHDALHELGNRGS
ncbi:MAG: cytidine deaminase [Spirochaetaceae bacterium]|nr:cytidine deaminase [Spirochaetaceae bacterium]